MVKLVHLYDVLLKPIKYCVEMRVSTAVYVYDWLLLLKLRCYHLSLQLPCPGPIHVMCIHYYFYDILNYLG